VTSRAREFLRELDLEPRAGLALRLTLVALLLSPVGGPWTRPVFMLVAAAALLFTPLRRSALCLGALPALAAWRVVVQFPLGDNHAWLLAWWLLALLLASRARDADAVLAWNARWLIAGVFTCATAWKLLSPDFTDGRFFLVTLVDDSRLQHFAQLAGGLDAGQLHALRDLVREHQDGLRVPGPDDPLPTERLIALARLLTWSLLALEATVALVFLAPLRTRIARLRHAVLLGFCASVYALAPVVGFGWLLLAMGVAQCEPERTGTRRAYLAVFAWVLLAARWPWLRALAG
jgi:hypothetical protein